MVAFIEIQGLVDDGEKEGSMISENFKYTNTKFLDYSPFTEGKYGFGPAPFDGDGSPISGVPPINFTEYRKIASSLQACYQKNKGRYYWSKLGIIAADAEVRQDAVNFFNDYVFKL